MTVTLNNPANAITSGGSTGANPTASVGLTAVNGTANTFLRSDGAPALDQTIAPTWSSVHTFQQAVAATSTDGVVLSTSATATSGNQKYSPRLRFRGSYFSGSAKTTDWTIDNQPTSSGGLLVLAHSDNGGTYANQLTISSAGVVRGTGGPNSGLALGQLGGSDIVEVSGTTLIFLTGGTNINTSINRAGSKGFQTTSDGAIYWGNSTTNITGYQTYIYSDAAASIRFGAAAANPPVAQTLSVQDASGTDIAGATWTFRASRGTGAGAVTGKSFSWQTPDAGSTGTTLQTATEKMFLTGDGKLSLVAPLGGLGYGTGAGGAVTQATSRTTGVTINKVCGAITLVSAAGTTTWQTFTVTNSAVDANDVVVVCQQSGTDLNEIHVTNVAAGSFKISFRTTGGTTTEQPVFNFAIIKAVNA